MVYKGYFENGVFTPDCPILCKRGRQEAVLIINDCAADNNQKEKGKIIKRKIKLFPMHHDSMFNGMQEKLLLGNN